MPQIRGQLEVLHSKVPLLKKLPPRAVAIVVVIALINCVVWAAVGVVLVSTKRGNNCDILNALNIVRVNIGNVSYSIITRKSPSESSHVNSCSM